MKECINVSENKVQCPCTYEPCSRKGIYCECIKHHREKGELPACFFPKDVERTYDRSVQKFLEVNKK